MGKVGKDSHTRNFQNAHAGLLVGCHHGFREKVGQCLRQVATVMVHYLRSSTLLKNNPMLEGKRGQQQRRRVRPGGGHENGGETYKQGG